MKIDASLHDVAERAGPLTEYAWKFRYPGQSEEPSVAETREALALAGEGYAAILARLPERVRP